MHFSKGKFGNKENCFIYIASEDYTFVIERNDQTKYNDLCVYKGSKPKNILMSNVSLLTLQEFSKEAIKDYLLDEAHKILSLVKGIKGE